MKIHEHFNAIAGCKIVGELKMTLAIDCKHPSKLTNMTFTNEFGDELIRCWMEKTVEKKVYHIMYDIVDRWPEKKNKKHHGWKVDPAIKGMTARDRYYARRRLRNA